MLEIDETTIEVEETMTLLTFEVRRVKIHPTVPEKGWKNLTLGTKARYIWLGTFGEWYWVVWCPTKSMYLCSCKNKKTTFCVNPDDIDQNFIRKGRNGIERMVREKSGADKWRRYA